MQTQLTIPLFLTALLGASVNACLPSHRARHETDASHTETQLKLLEARSQSVSTQSTGKTALTNVRILDGWRIGEPTNVIIDGDSITFDASNVRSTIDGEGGVLLPGLIDSHIHVNRLASLETLTSYGVTTAMNMGCDNYTLCSALHDQPGLTTLFNAGQAAAAPNSTHATVFGAHGYVNSTSQAPEFVANVFRNGSDYMKLISEPNGFSQAIHDALVNATHALGRVAMTHAQDYGSYEVAIRSQTDGLQHVPFDIPLTQEMARRIRRQVQYVTPTLNIAKLVTANRTIESIISPGVSLTYEAGIISVQRLLCAGVPILAGTDANDLADTFLHGDLIGITLYKKLQLLTAAGMSEVDVIRSATVIPSIWHNLTRRGSIEEGYRAELLLLKPGSDPLQSISQTMDIARIEVTTKAKPVAPEAADMTTEERLASMREFAEEQKYIQPGGGEIIPASSSTSDGGFNSVVFGNPEQGGAFSLKVAPAYQGHLAPSTWTPPEKERRSSSSPLKHWAEKRHAKKEEANAQKGEGGE
ncbi:hypothetical protein B0A55_03451 [Friedmanniomyces simplex]|uniref:Amidohydrolase-related domain-containing protein n=1 Tax=Friedmanniomyces simplex TaxID=329884 RepID=A0A4U0XW51_9PEZI|nr:hypothetical protein B0A55_03451 [Friedmanniomyces simplex]